MALTPGESDRLLLHLQASLAQARRDRGLALNVPEARALIAEAVCEAARDGLSLEQARQIGCDLLAVDDVLPAVPEAIGDVRVEARFDDGTRLVVVTPFAHAGEVPANPDEAPVAADVITVVNESGTAIAVTSHIHLAEVNPRLRLDRARAFGMRPALPTGHSQWIAPGEALALPVTPIGGARIAIGTSGAVDGALDDPAVRARALTTLRDCGYLDVVDGRAHGTAEQAEQAVGRLLRRVTEDPT